MPKGESAVADGYVRVEGRHEKRPLSMVLDEHDLATSQRRKRIKLLKEIDSKTKGKSATIAFTSGENVLSGIDGKDIPAFGDILMSVGDVDTLNLIIDSPGGDGTVAEKLIELCRAYCKTFRVLIPNRAKSAATIIALGADEILMGHCSELGPIDAQVPVIVAGIPRYVSAQSFIDARDGLQAVFGSRIAKDPKADVRDVLQQLASIDVTFIDHCAKLMEFSRNVSEKNLSERMFASVKNKAARDAKVKKIISALSSPQHFQVHGRMIDGHRAKTELGLNVTLIPKDDPLWKAVWTYYIRSDVFLSRTGAAKMVESTNEMLMLAPTSVM
jgi:hypothetical protein